MRPIAINLAQFHEMELNNKWWGKGFTDWDKVKTACPLYEGHYQPRIPLNRYYYDMSKKETLVIQTDQMKKYSVYGMAYYHYWYNDGPVMDAPLELLLKCEDIDQKFMFFWSNCDWYYSEADSYIRKMMLRQEYGQKHQWKIHIDYLIRFFKDKRYITYEGKPVLIIYRPGEIPCFDEMLDFFREECIGAGLEGLYVVEHLFNFGEQAYAENSDAIMFREPNCSKKYAHSVKRIPPTGMGKDGSISTELDAYQYGEMIDISLKKQAEYKGHKKQFFSVFSSWDNTPRHRYKGYVVEDSTPALFERYLIEIEKKLDNKDDFVFINAWNEWAEGMYLEPDEKNGYGYLSAVRNAVDGIETESLSSSSENYYDSLVRKINAADRVYLYGAGVYGSEALDFINKYCINGKVCGFIDDTKEKINTKLRGVSIISLDDFDAKTEDALVLVCCDERSHMMMVDKLRRHGVEEDSIVIPRIAFMDPEKDSKFIRDNMHLLTSLSEMLADDTSRLVLRNVIEYKLTHDQSLLENIADKVNPRYYDEHVLGGIGKGVIIDCGSYIGDSLDGYVDYSGAEFKGALCCEANSSNIERLTEHIRERNYKNVEIVDRAIWKSDGLVRFHPAGEKSGYISEDGVIELNSTTVDILAHNRRIDFIKIEVDGAEYEALLGAMDTIISQHPVIAISVYHKPEDIIRIPLMLKSLRIDYRLYLRFYGCTTLTDIVCYAVPSER